MKMGKKGTRMLSLLLMAALLVTSIPMPAYAAEVEDTLSNVSEVVLTEVTEAEYELEQEVAEPGMDPLAAEKAVAANLHVEKREEFSRIETSAMAMNLLSVEDGTVDLKDTNEVEWIDRIDIPDEIRAFYNQLVEGADNDGTDDILIDDTYYTDENYLTAITVTSEALSSVDSAGLSAFMNDVYARYMPFISAAFFAFDRDYPEVFWLDGSCVIGCTAGANVIGAGTYQYYVDMYFYLKIDGFDVRETDYQSQSVIEATITERDSDVSAITSAVAGKSNYEKMVYFNEVLTTTNEYNTSADLNNILHEARECIGALGGYTGTEGPVCEAYARAFKVLCDTVGIPCVLVDGYAKSSASDTGEAHMWNYAQLDGAWYAVDVTWNDPVVYGISGAVSGYESTDWLLLGSETEVGGLTFIESHPVANQPSSDGLGFTNGPVLSETAYVPSVATTISEVASYKGSTAQSEFTYGDVITIKAKVTADDVVATTQTMGLYYGDTKLTESSIADANGVYTLTYDTTAKKVPAKSVKELTLSFAGGSGAGDEMAAAKATVSVTIQPATPTVAFVADSLSLTYTGEPAAVQILVNDESYDGTVTYEYMPAGNSTYVNGLPTDAGTYTVRASIAASSDGFYTSAVSEAATLTIEKSSPTMSLSSTYYNEAVCYGDGALVNPTSSELTLTGAAYSDVVFTWYKDSVSDANKLTTAPYLAGQYVLRAELEEGSNNYAAHVEKAVEIKAKEITITALDYEMEYGETVPQSVEMVAVNPALASGDAMASITLTASTTDITTSGVITPANVVIKNGNEDRTANYDVVYKTGKLTITAESISGAKVTLAVPTEGYTYDKTEKKPAVTVVLDGTTLVEGTDYSVAYKNNVNAGTDTAEVVVTGTGNYSGSVTKKFSIQKVVLEPEVTVATKTYDGTTDAEITVEVDPENKILAGDTVEISGAKGTFASKNAGTAVSVLIEAGEVTGTNAGNYDVQMPTSVTGKITRRPVTVTADTKSKNYGEKDPELTYTIDSSTPLVTGESLSGALSRESGENCGTYAIVQNTLTDANNANYKITFNAAELTIKQVSYTVDIIAEQTVLEGDLSFAEPDFIGVNGEFVSGTLSYTYNGVSDLYYDDIISYLESLPVGTTIQLTYIFVPVTDGNYTGTKEGTLTLTVRDVEFLVDGEVASIDNVVTIKENPVYGDTWSDIVQINTDLLAKRGEETDTEDSHFTLNVTGSPVAGESEFSVLYNGEVAGKTYTNVVVCSGTVEVAKKTVSVEAGTYKVSKVYDKTTNPGTGTGELSVEGILAADTTVAVDVLIGAYENANVGGQSSMEVTLSLSGEGKDNYQLKDTKVTVPCEILKKAVTPEILVSGTYTYTGSAITPTYVVQADGDTLAATDYDAVISDNVNAGTATIAITEKEGGNYTWTGSVKQTFVIAKAVYDGEKSASAKTRFGNEGSVDLTSLLPNGAKLGTLAVTDEEGILSTVTLDGTVLKYDIIADENAVGKAAVVTVPVTETTNYEAFELTITITASDKLEQEDFGLAEETVDKTYGDAEFTIAATGQAEGSTVTYTSSNPEIASVDAVGKVTILKAGTVTITATASETDDYHAASDSYVLNIAKIVLTWNTSEIYAVDREDSIVNQKASLYGVLQLSGILEADAETAVFTCPVDKLTGTYRTVTAGEQIVDLAWADAANPVVLTGDKAENYVMPESLPQIAGTINAVEEVELKPEGETQYKLVVENGISQVPEAFKNDDKLNTPDKIENEMRLYIQNASGKVSSADIEVSDVELQMKVDEGWVKVTAENFPEDGVTIILPYPAGTSGSTHNFEVAHLFTEDVNGHKAGSVEYPVVTKTVEGIQFKVHGLSPIAVGWSKINSGSSYTPPSSSNQTTPVSPKTGGETPIIFYAMLFAVVSIGLTMDLRRKKNWNK